MLITLKRWKLVICWLDCYVHRMTKYVGKISLSNSKQLLRKLEKILGGTTFLPHPVCHTLYKFNLICNTDSTFTSDNFVSLLEKFSWVLYYPSSTLHTSHSDHWTQQTNDEMKVCLERSSGVLYDSGYQWHVCRLDIHMTLIDWCKVQTL